MLVGNTTGIIVNNGFTLNNYYKSITLCPSLKFSYFLT